jgi:hypothetical protein
MERRQENEEKWRKGTEVQEVDGKKNNEGTEGK